MKPLISIGADPDACWLWLGKVKSSGYGHKQLAGKTLLAHRWVYSIFVGHIPENCVIDHLCRVRTCVNPRHLDVVSVATNVRRGIGTKLTEAQVVEIKKRIPALQWGERKSLAAEYGVSPALISDIKHGRAWADI